MATGTNTFQFSSEVKALLKTNPSHLTNDGKKIKSEISSIYKFHLQMEPKKNNLKSSLHFISNTFLPFFERHR